MSNVNGSNEMIENEITGIIIRKDDSDNLTEKLEYLMKAKNRRHEIGQQARKHIINKFSWGDIATSYKRYILKH